MGCKGCVSGGVRRSVIYCREPVFEELELLDAVVVVVVVVLADAVEEMSMDERVQGP